MTETGSWWICPSCGMRNNAADQNCMNCRGATTIRVTKAPPSAKPTLDPASITFPLTIPDARFSLTFPTGPQWTSGALRVSEKGLALLSAQDKIDVATFGPEPDVWSMIGSLSVFVPKGDLKRVVNSKTLGQAIETATGRIPLRLERDGWAKLEAACRKIGVAWQ